MPSRGPHGGERPRRLHHHCFLQVQMVGRDGYGCITPAFSGSPWWKEINMATSPLPSQVPHGGERSIGLHHPFLLGVPMVGRNQEGYNTPTFSRSPWWGGIDVATSPLPSRVPHGGEESIWPHTPAFSGSPWWEEINMAAYSYLLGVPMVGRDQYGYITHVFSGSPWWGEIIMATSPLPSSGPHCGERSILLHHPCPLGVPMVGRDQYGYITEAKSVG